MPAPVDRKQVVDWVIRGGHEWVRMIRDLCQDGALDEKQLAWLRTYQQTLTQAIEEATHVS